MDDKPLAVVKKYLELQQFDSAAFICERAYAQNKDQASLFYLATCYLAQGKTSRAYEILQKEATILNNSNKYMLAVCAIAKKRFTEAAT